MPRMDGQINRIRIRNCKVLRIAAETFTHLSMLRSVELANIEDLILDARSLAFNRNSFKINLSLTNVVIEELPSHTISGRVDELLLERCRIGAIRAFSISGLTDEMFSFTMRNSTINQVDPQVLAYNFVQNKSSISKRSLTQALFCLQSKLDVFI